MKRTAEEAAADPEEEDDFGYTNSEFFIFRYYFNYSLLLCLNCSVPVYLIAISSVLRAEGHRFDLQEGHEEICDYGTYHKKLYTFSLQCI